MQKYCATTFIRKNSLENVYVNRRKVVLVVLVVSARRKVIFKSVSSIIGIGYSITWLGESTVRTLEATVFTEIKDFIPFHEFLASRHLPTQSQQ